MLICLFRVSKKGLTLLGSKTITESLVLNLLMNLAAIAHPPEPPPITRSLHLRNEIAFLNQRDKMKKSILQKPNNIVHNLHTTNQILICNILFFILN